MATESTMKTAAEWSATIPDSYPPDVIEAIKILDTSTHPECDRWWQSIAPQNICLASVYQCILGQLFGRFDRGLYELGFDRDYFKSWPCGFLPSTDPVTGGVHFTFNGPRESAWKAEVYRRCNSAD